MVYRQHLERHHAAGPVSSAAPKASPGPDRGAMSREYRLEFYWPEVNSLFQAAPDKITCLLWKS